MRLRQFLTGAALVSMTLTITPTLPAPSSLIAQDKVLASAYFDTLSILSTTNGCSAFFGGPKASVDIFNQLIGRVRKKLGNRHEPELV